MHKIMFRRGFITTLYKYMGGENSITFKVYQKLYFYHKSKANKPLYNYIYLKDSEIQELKLEISFLMTVTNHKNDWRSLNRALQELKKIKLRNILNKEQKRLVKTVYHLLKKRKIDTKTARKVSKDLVNLFLEENKNVKEN